MPTEKITVDEYRRRVKIGDLVNTQNEHAHPRSHKFGAEQTSVDGVVFSSRLEAERYVVLTHAQRKNLISGLKLQPQFEVQRAFRYKNRHIRPVLTVMDFQYEVYVDGTRHIVVEDTKGFDNPLSRLKRKLFLAKYGHLDFRIVKSAADPVGYVPEERRAEHAIR